MATLTKLPSGAWRAQVRRKGRHLSRSFRLKSEAEAWAIQAGRAIQLDKNPNGPSISSKKTFGELIDLHISDLDEVGRPLPRSKAKCLEKLKADLGGCPRYSGLSVLGALRGGIGKTKICRIAAFAN